MMSPSIPSLIICGSQTPLPTSETLGQLASCLEQSPDLKPLREAILALPDVWAAVKKSEPHFQCLRDSPVIRLRDWLALPSSSRADINIGSDILDTLPNTLLAPLTVIIHIVQYQHYLDTFGMGTADTHDRIRDASVSAAQGTGALSKFRGLCIGSLTAAALDCSPIETALGENAVAAVNLAMCIGAYIDLERLAQSSPEMVCFIARWGADHRREDMEGTLTRYSEAYISVELDNNSVTITTPSSDIRSLQRELSDAGVRVADIPVRGRYHSRKNEHMLQSLLKLCLSPFSPCVVPWGAEKLEDSLRSILTEPAHWFSDISRAVNPCSSGSNTAVAVLELGLVSCLPPSLGAVPHHHIIRGSLPQDHYYHYPESSVAIVGAACKYPGADNLDQLWTLVSMGQVVFSEAPPGRFEEAVTGSFLSDADIFDNECFGVSPREATYMDPQQRIALQVAYRAVESSGYFSNPTPDLDVGCYVGVGSSDYEHKVNSNPPTAYSFTGTSRAFVGGRISHFFKWTGPSMTIDTACSSSATAIHQACNALAMGDCSVALAGGVHIMSSLPANRHIGAAGMTNPSGPCRPFDAGAAGYSRSEGCGFVVLKRLSAAIGDGDHILGVIAATATNQSDGTDSITVPVMQSQVNLMRRALSRAAMSPSDISYVEAHGTGTRRGDPVEYQSVREVFAENQEIRMGSLKANIGHAESASGVAGMLKVLMMLRHGRIPAQANFASLNPTIPLQEPANSPVIGTHVQKWDRRLRAACINNYGAAGHNAAIVLCQPPQRKAPFSDRGQSLRRYPFLICAHSPTSLKGYCVALRDYIEAKSLSLVEAASLVARQQNRNLHHCIAFSAASISDLQDILRRQAHSAEVTLLSVPSSRQARPVVLVFGGQTSSAIHFSKAVYDGSYYLRQHIDRCDAVIREMGLPSVFPHIFSSDSIDDVVILHACLFSVQYGCAAAWLDAGISIDRVIGHSFGQLTAMCIAGVITLDDALKLIIGRAHLIRDCWGDEKGCMLSVEIDRGDVETLAHSEPGIEVACYNGPNNHVFVGTQSSITSLQRKASSLSLPVRRLKTTHGFHSHLIEPLMTKYVELARTISFRGPVIPIETCSEAATWETFTAERVAEHSRQAVYFCDAVRRIERDLGPCTWLEAGSGLGAVSLAKQSLDSQSNSLCGLHLGSFNGTSPLESVVDVTLELWRRGVSVQCWMYHPKDQMHSNDLGDMPGYHFDPSSYWLSCTGPSTYIDPTAKSPSLETENLVSLTGLSHPEPRVCRLDLNQRNGSLAHILRGREVLGEPLWPLALYMDVIAQAATLLTPIIPSESCLIRFTGLKIHAPLGARAVDGLCVRLRQTEMWTWEFSLESDSALHAKGTVNVEDRRTTPSPFFNPTDYSSLREATPTAVVSAPGGVAYKLLEKVVEYDPAYRGIELIWMNNDAAKARGHLPPAAAKYGSKGVFNPILFDQFLAVAEIHALSMEDSKRSEVFTCSGFSEATILATCAKEAARARTWSVYTRQSSKEGRQLLYDVFVLENSEGEDEDQDNGMGRLVLALHGARFVRTSTPTLQQILERANALPESPGRTTNSSPLPLPEEGSTRAWSVTVHLLQELTHFLPEQMSPHTVLADLGMDSLAVMELEARLRAIFNLAISGLVALDSTVETICDKIAAAQASHGLSISSSLFTPSGSGSGSDSPSVGFGSETQTTETSLSHDTSTLEKVIKIVAAHSGNRGDVLPSSRFHGLGLDSLAILELQSDLYATFGVKVNLVQVDDSTTISNLHAMVNP